MIDTLEILPGFFRSSLASTDVRECLREEACVGGVMPNDYCAEGYTGPCMLITSLEKLLCYARQACRKCALTQTGAVKQRIL